MPEDAVDGELLGVAPVPPIGGQEVARGKLERGRGERMARRIGHQDEFFGAEQFPGDALVAVLPGAAPVQADPGDYRTVEVGVAVGDDDDIAGGEIDVAAVAVVVGPARFPEGAAAVGRFEQNDTS